jgi:hypothetical protein
MWPAIAFIITFVFIPTSILAQTGSVTFTKTTHDFGQVNEGTTPVYTFEFTNSGTKPVKLLAVNPSCGCTTPEYSKAAVAPGKKGFIKVAYDTNGRPGIIDKSIAIQTDGNPEWISLYIKGMVMSQRLKGADLTQIGNILFNKGTLPFKNVALGTSVSQSLEFQNTGTRAIKIVKVESAADIDVKYPKFSAQPQEIFQITVYFKPDSKRKPGAFKEAIRLITDDPQTPAKRITLTGVLTSSTAKSK